MEIPDVNSFCRLCLSETIYLSVLDETVPNLRNKIYSFVGIEVRENDKISRMICRKCFDKVEEWWEYKKTCNEVQYKLQDWLSERLNEIIMPKIEPNDMDYQENVEAVHIKVENPDNFDNESNSSDYSQNSASSLLVPTKEQPVNTHQSLYPPEYCHVCHKSYASLANRIRHQRQVHKMNVTKETLMSSNHHDENTNDGYYSDCSDVSQATMGSQAGSQVKLNVRNKVFPLPRTEKEFVSYYTKMCHMIKNQLCLYCDKNFDNFKELSSHLRKQHMKIEVFVCYFCWISFPDVLQYRKHMEMKAECRNRAILLSEDPLPFKPYQNFKCEYCGMLYTCEETMKAHFKRHTPGEYPEKCEKCNLELTNSRDFNEHMSSSCIYRVYCGICKYDFGSMDEFNEHTFGHDVNYMDGDTTIVKMNNEEEKNEVVEAFSCRLCQDVFKSKCSLLKHRKYVHKDPSVTVCCYCRSKKDDDKKYVLYSEYSNHVRLEHDLEVDDNCTDNDCSLCGVKCNDSFELQQHVDVNHKELIENENFSDNSSLSSSNLKLKLYRVSDTNSYVTSSPNLDETPRYNCETCDKYFLSLMEYQEHEKIHETKESYSCSTCLKVFMSKSKLMEHENSVHHKEHNKVKKAKKWQCIVCNMSFKNKRLYQRHCRRKHRNNVSDVNPNVTRSCQQCNIVFKTALEFSTHLQSHLNDTETPDIQKFTCKICDEEFTTLQGIETHQTTCTVKKPKEIFIKCKVCGSNFQSNLGLKFHLKANNCQEIRFSNKHVCKYCKRKFSSSKVLRRHVATHTTNNTLLKPKPHNKTVIKTTQKSKKIDFRCLDCNIKFPSMESLQSHLADHKKQFYCVACKVQFTSIYAYNSHKGWHKRNGFNHTPKTGTYHCKACDETFTSSKTFYIHRRSICKELDVTKYTCNYCNLIYLTFGRYQNHMLTSHGITVPDKKPEQPDKDPLIPEVVMGNHEKNYSCTQCDLWFKDSKSLRGHVSKHIH